MVERDKIRLLKDILLWDFRSPFPKGEDERTQEETREESIDNDLRGIVEKLEAEERDIGDLFAEKGLLEREALDRVRREQELTGLGFPQALIRLKIMPPSRVSEVLRGRILERGNRSSIWSRVTPSRCGAMFPR